MQTEWSSRDDDTPAAPPARWAEAADDAAVPIAVEVTSVDAAGPVAVEDTAVAGAGGENAAEEDLHRSAVDAVDGLLDEVERALARLDDGTYGRCEGCGEPIDDGRLAELPIVRTCGSCDEVGGGTVAPEPVGPAAV